MGRELFDDKGSRYYLVRWRPPFAFAMAGVSDKPFADCTERADDVDEAEWTLFPPQ